MAQRKSLTENQIAILRWIAAGCPAGVMANDFHRISAAALRTRRLIETSGCGPAWQATLTPAGRAHLAELDGPTPPLPRRANVSVTQQLVDDVVAAGGVLRFPSWGRSPDDGVDYEKRANLARRHGKVPAGKRLTVTTVGSALELRLVDASHHIPAPLVPVLVPTNVRRYHPAARLFRDHPERHEVARGQLARATRIVHAIATEAERRGWPVQAAPCLTDRYGPTPWMRNSDGHLQLTAGGETFRLRLREQGVRTRGPWEEQVASYRGVDRDSPYFGDRDLPSGAYDAAATGRFQLKLQADRDRIYRGRQSTWADGQSATLEALLARLFREIEERIVEAARVAEDERIAAARAAEAGRLEAEQRERTWHTLMEQATERLVAAHRVAELRRQSETWHEAERLRRYCEALGAAHGDNPATAEWLAWARAHASASDPLAAPPSMPQAPVASAEALQEHLPSGWSAEGP